MVRVAVAEPAAKVIVLLVPTVAPVKSVESAVPLMP